MDVLGLKNAKGRSHLPVSGLDALRGHPGQYHYVTAEFASEKKLMAVRGRRLLPGQQTQHTSEGDEDLLPEARKQIF